MTDLQGNIIVSPNATTIYLSSSESAVLSVPSTVVLEGGQQYVIVNVTTTATPGTSVVTAVSPGFEAASAAFQTVTARGYPTGLNIYPLPASFPSGVVSNAEYAVSVVDAAGFPAKTIGDTSVNVTSSDTGLLTVGSTQIPSNQTFGYFRLSTTGLAGTAEIAASSSGLVSASTLVSVVTNSTAGVNLLLSTPSVPLPADGKTYNVLTVSLLDNASRPTTSPTGVQVFLTSSRTDIATVPSSVTVPPGQSFVTIPVTTYPASGSAIITATSTNFVSSSATVSTVSIPPTQLGMYLSDEKALLSKAAHSVEMVIQLQDASGNPSEARTPASLVVSFSNASMGEAPITLTIPKGSDLVYERVNVSQSTSGTFTAISNGLGPASIGFVAVPLVVRALLNPATPQVTLGQSATITFSLQAQGNPIVGANVTWSSPNGTFSNTSTTTNAQGTSSVTFLPSTTGFAYVVATASSPVTGTVNATYYISVLAPQTSKPLSLEARLLTFPYILIIIGGAAAAVIVVVFFVLRRRKRAAEVDGALSEDEQGFNYFRGSPGGRPFKGSVSLG